MPEIEAATGSETHNIDKAVAAKLTKNYREAYGIEESKGFYYGKEKIKSIIEQKGCMGIRVYYGLNSIGEDTLVLVAVDGKWNDIGLTNVAEYGISTALHADSSGSMLARD